MSGKVVMAKGSVVAAEHPLASQAGLNALQREGNAFDAAAAASLMLAVTQPHLGGLGGDYFGLFYSAKDRKIFCLNSSGWSPSSQTAEGMRAAGHKRSPTYGQGSVVIPGYVKGIYDMHRRFGKLEFSDDAAEAISLAEGGFPIGNSLLRSLNAASDSLSPAAEKVYLGPRGGLRVGDLLKQKTLGASIRGIAEDGPNSFYAGTPAKGIREEMGKGGIEVDEEDLSSYEPEWCEPLEMDYNGTRVFEVPPNSMGATTLLILRLLMEEKAGARHLKPNSAERIRLTVGAARVAYAARDAQLGDPRFMKGGFDMDEFLRRGSADAREQRRLEGGDTTYFAVADHQGNLLSCIQSLFHGLGSRVYVEKGGFFLNNRGSSFDLKGRGPNLLEPRKRPLHTLSSLILSRDGEPFVAAGASGGDWRPQQHALFTTNIVDYSMDIAQAVDYPRFIWDGGNSLLVEEGYTGLGALKMRKTLLKHPGPTGVAQGAQRMAECVEGVCDLRGEGLPAGN